MPLFYGWSRQTIIEAFILAILPTNRSSMKLSKRSEPVTNVFSMYFSTIDVAPAPVAKLTSCNSVSYVKWIDVASCKHVDHLVNVPIPTLYCMSTGSVQFCLKLFFSTTDICLRRMPTAWCTELSSVMLLNKCLVFSGYSDTPSSSVVRLYAFQRSSHTRFDIPGCEIKEMFVRLV